MLTLKFKNVGLGDSIFISWSEGDKTKIGIIDCCKYGADNPILDEIKAIENDFEFVFFIVSHGHQDHYSGAKEVFAYCEKNNVVIQNFISTLHPYQVQFFNTTLQMGKRQSISELMNTVNLLYKRQVIAEIYPAYNKIIKFELENYSLECIYPRQADYTNLGDKLNKYLKGQIKTQPDLNYISTIFKLTNTSLYALLTSDCTRESLDNIVRKDQDVQDKELHLAQVPHHGSSNNHNRQFWKNRKRIADCPAVISCGESRYHLPNEEVVQDFSDLGYKIYSTNKVYGIKPHAEDQNKAKAYTYVLNLFSELTDEYSTGKSDQFRGDKVFHLNKNSINYIPQN